MGMSTEQMEALGLWQPDKYDEAIDYLTEYPEEIGDAWNSPKVHEHEGGILFGFVALDWGDNKEKVRVDGVGVGTCGCLQQIRKARKDGYDGKSGSMAMSHWPRLWKEIARDRRLPIESGDITVKDLPVFAEWQRKLDILREQAGYGV